VKWSKDGSKLISASFDGTAKLWEFNQRSIESNKNNCKSIATLCQDANKASEKACWALSWSCENNYFIASFTIKMRIRREGVKNISQLKVYDMNAKKVLRVLDSDTTPIKMESNILIIDT
jgi:bromodomain and WD repeat domain-containing protein 1/3